MSITINNSMNSFNNQSGFISYRRYLERLDYSKDCLYYHDVNESLTKIIYDYTSILLVGERYNTILRRYLRIDSYNASQIIGDIKNRVLIITLPMMLEHIDEIMVYNPSIEYIYIFGADISTLNFNMICFPECRTLQIIESSGTVSGIDEATKLERVLVDVKSTLYIDAPIATISYPKLKVLSLAGVVNLTIHIFGLAEYFSRLVLPEQVKIGVWDINTIRNLEHLEMYGRVPKHIVKDLYSLKKIRKLGFHSYVDEKVDFKEWPLLKSLDLQNMDLSDYDVISFPQGIVELNLGSTRLRKFPENIINLPDLKKLSLADNHFQSLPAEILHLNLHFTDRERIFGGININNLLIDDMDTSLLMRNRAFLADWFAERDSVKNNAKPLNEAKVIFLGDGEAGKSLSIARLLNDGEYPENFDGESTPGIAISHNVYKVGDEKIWIHYWDFGGQEMMHSMHRMFLTKRTLYVVFVNVRENTQDDRARYWIHNIKNFAPGSHVVLVLNKMDQNPNATINENGLKRLYEGLDVIVRLSALKDSKIQFKEKLEQAILNAVCNMDIRNVMFPNTWALLKKRLDSLPEYYINRHQYLELCSKCGISNDEETRDELVDWMGDLGVCFCYRRQILLSDYMILNPKWITNAIYIILFNGKSYAKNGIISHNDIYNLLLHAKILGEKAKSVLEIQYEIAEISYVLGVIRNFHLSYRFGENQEFIPMLCENNELPVVKEYQDNDDIQEFIFDYDYLPNNVFYQFMVEMHSALNYENVWLTGAEFLFPGYEMSMLVLSEDSRIHIYIQNDSAIYKSGELLHRAIESFDYINQRLSLKPEKRVIYKEDGIIDEFDYDLLIEDSRMGGKDVFSKAFHRRVKIESIVMNAGEEARLQEDGLVRDIIHACQQLQGQKIFYNSDENDRNTYIRNELRARQYIISDQTLDGLSLNQKSAGELDLAIYSAPDKMIAVYEGLNLSLKTSFTNTAKSYWEKHFKKLIDNYNPRGLPYGFLVSYVNCPKNVFGKVYNQYWDCISRYTIEDCIISGYETKNIPEHFIKTDCVSYQYCGFPVKIYHIFMRISDPNDGPYGM